LTRLAARRLVATAFAAAFAAMLAGCSGGIDRSEYTTPVTSTSAPAPAPVVPVSDTGAAPRGRQPLLPPVPEDQSSLPPVTVAQLLPPTVK